MKDTQWTSDVDPQSKARDYGIASLTDAELLALVIRNGTKSMNALELATHILSGNEGLYALMEAEKEDLIAIEGIGEAKAYLLLAVQQIAKRASQQQRRFSLPLSNSREAADYVMQELRYEKQEYVVTIFLDTRMRIMSKEVLFKGTLDRSLFSTREILTSALKHRAASIILVHNHPSGDPSPSDDDMEITRKTKEAGYFLDIPLLDHIIIGDFKYYSFREHGQLV